MSSNDLTKKQIKYLKALAHGLSPVVRVGQHGLSEAVIKELKIALDRHELVKIKVAADDREAREAMLTSMASRTRSEVVQQIGGMVVLFKRNAEKAVIDLQLANSN